MMLIRVIVSPVSAPLLSSPSSFSFSSPLQRRSPSGGLVFGIVRHFLLFPTDQRMKTVEEETIKALLKNPPVSWSFLFFVTRGSEYLPDCPCAFNDRQRDKMDKEKRTPISLSILFNATKFVSAFWNRRWIIYLQSFYRIIEDKFCLLLLSAGILITRLAEVARVENIQL